MGRRRGYAIMDVRRLAAKIAKEAAYVSTVCKRADAKTVVAVDCVCTICESTAAPNVNESNCELNFRV
jgi:hypothetical protein